MRNSLILAMAIMSYTIIQCSMVYAEVRNDFDVKWILVKNDPAEMTYEFTVQNLLSYNRDFNLGVFLSDTSFNLFEMSDIELSEWKEEYYDEWVSVWECDDVYVPENETFKNVCTDNGYYREAMRCVWKPTKMAMFDQPDRKQIDYANINIPKFEAKDKDCVLNGIKRFRLYFQVPLGYSDKGWGSSGKVGIIDGYTGLEYHPEWYEGWAFRYEINLSRTVASTVYNLDWNITIDTTNATQFNHTNGCRNIRIVNATNNLTVPYHLENATHPVHGCNKTGTIIKFLVPSLPANDTQFFLYAGNLNATSGENRAGVYPDASFVWNGLSNSGAMNVSKGSANGTIVGTVYLAKGIIGDGIYIDGSNDYATFGDNYDPANANELTITTWANATQSASHNALFTKTDSSSDNAFQLLLRKGGDGYPIYFGYTGFASEISSGDARWILNEWVFVASVFNHSVQDCNFTVNGTSDSGNPQTTNTGLTGNNDATIIGGAGFSTPVLNDYKGFADELKMYDTAKSLDFIQMAYDSIMFPELTKISAVQEQAGPPPPVVVHTVEKSIVVCFKTRPICVNVADETIYLNSDNNFVWLI